ncbi:hypothetical protein M404DRAFT_1006566 [Pisolithus tinctorius Marx 270]|uniref:Uncharacterized protein n=1 Tax=Pisolithus tinctorius Marx 270 TaxID=870435 RepID=A0A0C3JGP5_PISTI|nr:hypothetical protein M404DRAFT_1006566 [Pisolithus tinctorius Marx 270]
MSESSQQPCVGYVSFFSDVEHEARVVTSCHPVTLTYNSYFIRETDAPPLILSISLPHDQTLAEAAYKFTLTIPCYPAGDILALASSARIRSRTPGTDVTGFRNYLKSPDTALGYILSAFGVSWNVRVFLSPCGFQSTFTNASLASRNGGKCRRTLFKPSCNSPAPRWWSI